jgi:hypothetical protein
MRKNTEQDFWKHVDKTAACWNWQGFKNPQGYGYFSWQGRNWLTHRLSLHFAGIDVTGKIACHHCDNPSCVNPAHLYAGTKQSNSDDARNRNRLWRAAGSTNPNAKLTEQQVLDIKQLSYSEAVARYGHLVSRGQICHIRYSKNSWQHV